MPRKRRITKTRELSDGCLEDQLYGPGTCLFDGDGYCAPFDDVRWWEATPEVQAAIVDTMRADWESHWPRVLQAWANRTPHELWCAKHHHDDPAEPWAQTEFGQAV